MKKYYRVTSNFSASVPVSVKWTCSRCGQLNCQEGTKTFSKKYSKGYSYYRGDEKYLAEDKIRQRSIDREDFEIKWRVRAKKYFQHPEEFPTKSNFTLPNKKCYNCANIESWEDDGIFSAIFAFVLILRVPCYILQILQIITSWSFDFPILVIYLICLIVSFVGARMEEKIMYKKAKRKNPDSMYIITPPDLEFAVLSVKTQTLERTGGKWMRLIETEDVIL